MDNKQVAEILETIGHILEIQDENPFKVRAYLQAARTIDGLDTDVARLVAAKKLGSVPGIGKALEEKITQLVITGKMDYLEELLQTMPPGVLDMLRIPFLGPKKVKTLWKEKGISDIETLRKACKSNILLELKGFGERTQAKILEGIEFINRNAGQYLLGQAMPVAKELLARLQECPATIRASLAGSIRRWKEVVRDIDLLVSSKAPDKVMRHLLKMREVTEVLSKGETKTSVRLVTGMQVDLRVVTDEQFPYALAHFTGSKEHNVAVRALAQKKKLKVSEYGIFKGSKLLKCLDENEFYARLGLPHIPPEMRENVGELELSEIPRLIEPGDIKGALHVHSVWSDGTTPIEELVKKAKSLGWKYMGISDHSKAAYYANGMDRTRLENQLKEIDRINEKNDDFVLLKGLECDILADGSLDLDHEILDRLDFVIGSIHSRFEMSRDEMTDRICKALSNKSMDIFAHPTGRLLLSREGYKVDLDRVIDEAARLGKVIEINANPNRLDLDWVHCRLARQKGVMVSIEPDAHSPVGLEDMEYGVATARRGWLEPKDVLNTRGPDDIRSLFTR